MKLVTITNGAGAVIDYEIEPWKGSHALEMLRRLLPVLQGAVATSGAIVARAKGTAAAKQLAAIFSGEQDAGLEEMDTGALIDAFGEISEKAGGDIANAIGWIADVLKREGDADLFMWVLDGTTRRTRGGSDGHRFNPEQARSREVFDDAYAGNLSEVFAVTVHILRENFSDFFKLGNDPAPSPAGKAVAGAEPTPSHAREQPKKRRSLAK